MQLINRALDDLVFRKADDLWKNVIENFSNYINQHGGISTDAPKAGVALRPKWDDAKDYLKGNITFAQLKTALGC